VTRILFLCTALAENMVNLQNTPDIGIHLSACYIVRAGS